MSVKAVVVTVGPITTLPPWNLVHVGVRQCRLVHVRGTSAIQSMHRGPRWGSSVRPTETLLVFLLLLLLCLGLKTWSAAPL